MSLNDLSKEQKQYLVFGGVVALVLALLIFGMSFILSSSRTAKAELDDLTGKIESAKKTLVDRSQVSSDILKTMDVLSGHFDNAPPDRNYYSWASEVIYSHARAVGLEVDSIDEIGGGGRKAPSDGKDSIQMGAYALRITAHGGYGDVETFIAQLKQDYPLVRFTALEISAGPDPEVHNVNLWLQWPSNLAALAEKWQSFDTGLLARKKQEVKQPAEPQAQPAAPSSIQKEMPVTEKVALQKPSKTNPKPQVAARSGTKDIRVVPKQEDLERPVAQSVAAIQKPEVAPRPEMVVESAAPVLPSKPTSAKAEPGKTEVEGALAKISSRPSETQVQTEPSVSPKQESSVKSQVADSEPNTEPVKPKSSQSDLDAVLATIIVDTFEAAPASEAESKSAVEEVEGIDDMDSGYVTTEKSSLKLERLLMDKSSLPAGATLNTLLGNLLEDSNGN